MENIIESIVKSFDEKYKPSCVIYFENSMMGELNEEEE